MKKTSGEGTWFVRKIGGYEYQCFEKSYLEVGVKTFYGRTKQQVRDKREAFEESLRNGSYIIKTKKDKLSEITLGDCCKELIFNYKQYNKNSTKGTDDMTRRYIDGHDISKVAISEPTKEDLISYMNRYS